MPDLKERAIALLSSTVIADLNAAATTKLYSVPAGKILIPTQIVVHSNGGTLVASGTMDINYGGGADSATPVWVDAHAGLEDMTATGDFYIITADDNENIVIDGDAGTPADREFSLTVVTGSDANGATFDLFGYLIDS
ncbi:hypothetical protein LCGC14_0825760 [marine sediment metagenome]|uniref:Uncharacterized protein n=1 Tax=marine sediment metagenome TaxID=412755 RepID=A0A0F9PHH6_9ZZZZ